MKKHALSAYPFGCALVLSSSLLLVACAAEKTDAVTPQATATTDTKAAETPATGAPAADKPKAEATASKADGAKQTATAPPDMSATVKKIDKKQRLLTLQFAEGQTVVLKTAASVRNFAKLQVNSKVVIEQYEASALAPKKADAPAASSTSGDGLDVTATAVFLNYMTRVAYLKDDAGRSYSVKVAPNVERFSEFEVGSTLSGHLSQILQLQVLTGK